MSSQSQDESFKQEIVANLRMKETDELLKIWQDNNRQEWSEEAFTAIHDILQERLGSVPEQEEILEEDTYHNREKLFSIAFWSKSISWVVMVLGLLLAIIPIIKSGFSLLLFTGTLILSFVVFFVLQALGEIIFILLDIYDNTRVTGSQVE
jgi:hypothetical protein